MLDQEDLQLIEQFNAENLQQKNRIAEEYRHYDIPNVYKNDRAKEAPTYELYLMNKIELSPEDEKAVGELGENAGTLERVRHLTSQVMLSEEWYQSVYGIGFFEQFNMNELSWCLYDAAILMSKLEGANRWFHSLELSEVERRKKGNYLWWILGFLLFLFAGELLSYGLKNAHMLLIYIVLMLGLGYFIKNSQERKKVELSHIQKEKQEAQGCLDWHFQKAGEHPLIQQQAQNSSSFFFDTMRMYVNEGRARTLQEALNLYHQEGQYNQLLQRQEAALQQTEQIQKMTTFNTIYNILKK